MIKLELTGIIVVRADVKVALYVRGDDDPIAVNITAYDRSAELTKEKMQTRRDVVFLDPISHWT